MAGDILIDGRTLYIGDDAGATIDGDDSGLSADKKASIQSAIVLTQAQGLTYDDAADAVGYSSSWVGDRVQEWKDGEHEFVEIDE